MYVFFFQYKFLNQSQKRSPCPGSYFIAQTPHAKNLHLAVSMFRRVRKTAKSDY